MLHVTVYTWVFSYFLLSSCEQQRPHTVQLSRGDSVAGRQGKCISPEGTRPMAGVPLQHGSNRCCPGSEALNAGRGSRFGPQEMRAQSKYQN